MGHNIREYRSYQGVPMFRDFNVLDDKQVYIGNGQGCHTFWFKSRREARSFIDRYRDRIKVTDLGIVTGLIPLEICQSCKGHYSYQSPEWKKAIRDDCEDYKEKLKKEVYG